MRQRHIDRASSPLFLVTLLFILTISIYTYDNLTIEIMNITTDKPAISVNPEEYHKLKLYEIVTDSAPITKYVSSIETINLIIPFKISNFGLIPSNIERITYRVYLFGIHVLSGTIEIGDQLTPGDSFTATLYLRIPILKSNEIINQLYYFDGFLPIYFEGRTLIRIMGLPITKVFSYTLDVDIKAILKSFALGRDVRIPKGELEVLNVKWISGDKQIYSASEGQKITAVITITSKEDDFYGLIQVYVYKDLFFYPDEILNGRLYKLNIGMNEVKIIYFTFKLPEDFESNLEGFYIVIKEPHLEFKWVMEDSYPPRLRAE